LTTIKCSDFQVFLYTGTLNTTVMDDSDLRMVWWVRNHWQIYTRKEGALLLHILHLRIIHLQQQKCNLFDTW